MPLRRIVTALFLLSTIAGTAFAQITPAAGYTPPDDTPSIRVGVTLFPLYTYQTTPEATDADGNVINRSSFDVARGRSWRDKERLWVWNHRAIGIVLIRVAAARYWSRTVEVRIVKIPFVAAARP